MRVSLLLGFSLILLPLASVQAQEEMAPRPASTEPADSVASVGGNPAAINVSVGTGALGRFLGLPEDSGVRLGGVWVGNASTVPTGGVEPGHWGLNSLLIMDLLLDSEKLVGFKGGSLGVQFLQYTGQVTNFLAGSVQGFNSIEGQPPLTRQELYELWWRQEFFDGKLIVRVGKSVPTYDFNNVIRPA